MRCLKHRGGAMRVQTSATESKNSFRDARRDPNGIEEGARRPDDELVFRAVLLTQRTNSMRPLVDGRVAMRETVRWVDPRARRERKSAGWGRDRSQPDRATWRGRKYLLNENPSLALSGSSPARTRERTIGSIDRNHGQECGGARFARLGTIDRSVGWTAANETKRNET